MKIKRQTLKRSCENEKVGDTVLSEE